MMAQNNYTVVELVWRDVEGPFDFVGHASVHSDPLELECLREFRRNYEEFSDLRKALMVIVDVKKIRDLLRDSAHRLHQMRICRVELAKRCKQSGASHDLLLEYEEDCLQDLRKVSIYLAKLERFNILELLIPLLQKLESRHLVDKWRRLGKKNVRSNAFSVARNVDKAATQISEGPLCRARMKHKLCDDVVVPGKNKCFKHGGAPGSGAPKGSQNAYKHGFRSAAWKEEGRQLRRAVAKLSAQFAATDSSRIER